MGDQLFSAASIWTMIHGIALGGGALVTLFAALFSLQVMDREGPVKSSHTRYLVWLMMITVVLLWLSVLVGTYIIFPPYRATPPEGLVDLTRFPKSFVQSNPNTAWLHSFAMETKEHVPWISAMLATAVAFIGAYYRSQVLTNKSLNQVATILLTISFLLVSYVALLGIFVNKAAPLQ